MRWSNFNTKYRLPTSTHWKKVQAKNVKFFCIPTLCVMLVYLQGFKSYSDLHCSNWYVDFSVQCKTDQNEIDIHIIFIFICSYIYFVLWTLFSFNSVIGFSGGKTWVCSLQAFSHTSYFFNDRNYSLTLNNIHTLTLTHTNILHIFVHIGSTEEAHCLKMLMTVWAN